MPGVHRAGGRMVEKGWEHQERIKITHSAQNAPVIPSNPDDWKYVPIHRTAAFLEKSIEEGIHWVVYEPNDETLWARVRRSVTDFLTRVWRDGALHGRKEEEAFFVKCD